MAIISLAAVPMVGGQMLFEAVLGAVHFLTHPAWMAGRPHEVEALYVVLHTVLALDDLGADETAPGIPVDSPLRHLDHILRHVCTLKPN